jgi:molecular chaperone GrpE
MSGRPEDSTGTGTARTVEDAEDAAEAAAEALEQDLVELQSERTELVDTLRRVQADFENYRKRMLREQTTMVERATERLVEQLLPVLDSFEGATSAAAGNRDVEKLRSGVDGIRAQLVAVLERAGLEPIRPEGARFDPNEHEAVLSDAEDDGAVGEPTVVETLRTGYRMKGRLLRPAMVRVGRPTPNGD